MSQSASRAAASSRRRCTAAASCIGFYVPPARPRAAMAQPERTARPPPDPNAFLRIGTDGTVTVAQRHSEMGQGIWTTLPMLVAEELGCDWSKIRVEHAPGRAGLRPHRLRHADDRRLDHDVVGVRPLPTGRRDGARRCSSRGGRRSGTCRRSQCRVENGDVIARRHARSASASWRRRRTKLTPPAKVRRSRTRGVDDHRQADAAARLAREGHGPRARSASTSACPACSPRSSRARPVFGGKVKQLRRARAAQAVPGVKTSCAVPSGVAVVAEHFWAAKLGRDALDVEWDPGAGRRARHERSCAPSYRALAPPARRAGRPRPATRRGARAAAAQCVEAEYEVPVPRPRADGAAELHRATSRGDVRDLDGHAVPDRRPEAAAEIAGLEPDAGEDPHHLPGRRLRPARHADQPTSSREAVQVAKAATGAPVKVVWTREDDIRGGYYRPDVHRTACASASTRKGRRAPGSTARRASRSLAGTPFEAMMVKNGVDDDLGRGRGRLAYLADVPDHLRRPALAEASRSRSLWWRSVGHSHTAFVMESLIDELAHAAGAGSARLPPHAPARPPASRCACSSWRRQGGLAHAVPPGRHRGIAVHESFGSFVAQVAEVSVERGPRCACIAWCARSTAARSSTRRASRRRCRAAIVFGLSAALHGEITFARRTRRSSRTSTTTRCCACSRCRSIEVHIVPSKEQPGGVGEPGVPPIAPAVANALFAATGKRLRQLPLPPEERRA